MSPNSQSDSNIEDESANNSSNSKGSPNEEKSK